MKFKYMRLILLFIIFLLVVQSAFSQDEIDPQLRRQWDRDILSALSRLDHPRQHERFKAIVELESLPREADIQIIKRISEMSNRARLHVFQALSNKGCEEVPNLIIKYAPQQGIDDEDVLVSCLIKLKKIAFEPLIKAATVLHPLDERNPAAERLLFLFIDKELTDHFHLVLTVYDAGHFQTLFRPVWYLGTHGTDWINKILTNNHRLILTADWTQKSEILRVAAKALIDWPLSEVEYKYNLEKMMKNVEESPWMPALKEEIKTQLARGLYRIGQRQHIAPELNRQRLMVEQLKSISAWDEIVSDSYRLGCLWTDLGEFEEALICFNEAVETFDKNANSDNMKYITSVCLYNKACILSRQNKCDEAVEALKSAWARGYSEFEWMFMDGDLENVWASQSWEKWMNELQNDSIAKPLMPDWKPGLPPKK